MFLSSNGYWGYRLYARIPRVNDVVVPPEIQLMRNVSYILKSLSSLTDDNRTHFIETVLADEGLGLRLLIQLLDTPDAQISDTVNSSLFAMACSGSALETIIRNVADSTANVTTLRWLTSTIAMLTSDTECLHDISITYESSHPVQAGTTYSHEVLCPLATKMIVTFHSRTEFEYGTLTLTTDQVTMKFNKENPARTVEIPGSKCTLSYTSANFSPWGYRLDVKGVFNIHFDIRGSCRAILASGGLKLLTEQSLQSGDATTQRMACRAIANMTFLPRDLYFDASPNSLTKVIEREKLKVSKDDSNAAVTVWDGLRGRVIEACLPKILQLAEAKKSPSPMLNTFARSKKSFSILYEVDHAVSFVGRVYFEAVLQSAECVMIEMATPFVTEAITNSNSDKLPDNYLSWIAFATVCDGKTTAQR